MIRIFRRPAGAVFLAVALLALGAGPVAAGDGWTSPLVIPAADFENSGVYPSEDNFYDSDGYFTGRSRDLYMVAPVLLPEGVTITRFEAAMTDIGGCGSNPDVQVDLVSNEYDDILNPPDTNVIVHATVFSDDNLTMEVFSDTTISSPVVQNLWRFYWVRVYSCGLFQSLQAVRIHYTR